MIFVKTIIALLLYGAFVMVLFYYCGKIRRRLWKSKSENLETNESIEKPRVIPNKKAKPAKR
jgi:uncharacterized membrane protein